MSQPATEQSPAFRITRTRTVPVVTYRQEVEVVYEGDDWFAAEEAYNADVTAHRSRDYAGDYVRFEGRDPTHEMADGRCESCGAPDNGCFKVHAPCGFDTGGKAIVTTMAEERARRVAPTDAGRS